MKYDKAIMIPTLIVMCTLTFFGNKLHWKYTEYIIWSLFFIGCFIVGYLNRKKKI
jgi:amino acid permease